MVHIATALADRCRASCRRSRTSARAVVAVIGAAAALSACSPLPGNTVDPVYGRFLPARDAASRADETPAPASQQSSAKRSATPPQARVAADAAAGEWIGRYVDSRGSGEIALTLVRHDGAISGSWRSRTGGGGPFTTAVGDDGRMTFRMENSGAQCPGVFDGWLEIRETTLGGAYHGRDCEGVVSDGRLDARRR